LFSKKRLNNILNRNNILKKNNLLNRKREQFFTIIKKISSKKIILNKIIIKLLMELYKKNHSQFSTIFNKIIQNMKFKFLIEH